MLRGEVVLSSRALYYISLGFKRQFTPLTAPHLHSHIITGSTSAAHTKCMVIVAISNGGEENIIKNYITGDNVITENNGDQRLWEHPYFWVSPPTNRFIMHLRATQSETQHFPNNRTRERPSDYCDVRNACLCVVK